MRIQPFKLERYFAEYEFKVRLWLSPSVCESLSLAELLAMADPDSRRLRDELRLSYTESQGHPVLRQEIADLYKSIHPDQVLVAAPEEAIFITMHALLEAGDEIVSSVVWEGGVHPPLPAGGGHGIASFFLRYPYPMVIITSQYRYHAMRDLFRLSLSLYRKGVNRYGQVFPYREGFP